MVDGSLKDGGLLPIWRCKLLSRPGSLSMRQSPIPQGIPGLIATSCNLHTPSADLAFGGVFGSGMLLKLGIEGALDGLAGGVGGRLGIDGIALEGAVAFAP